MKNIFLINKNYTYKTASIFMIQLINIKENDHHMSMTYNVKQVLKILLEADEQVTAPSIADKIGVSARTIIKYIGEINFFHPNLITSSRYGYCIDKMLGKALYCESQNQLPQTSKERIHYLLQKILLEPSDKSSIDLEYFADDICISFETAKKDLTKLKQKLNAFHLQANVNTYCITLEGSEFAKRNLLSNIIYENFDKNKISPDSIQQIFPDAKIDELYSLVTEQCKKHHYFINDCLLMNLILDILINVCRIQQESSLQKKDTHAFFPPRFSTLTFAENIAEAIAQLYKIPYNDAEISYLDKILSGYIMPANFKKMTYVEIQQFIDPEYFQIIDGIFTYIEENYQFIDLTKETFLTHFSLNLNNLLCRLKNKHWSNDPRKEDMKAASPFIFKCGTGIGEKLAELLQIAVLEDDITYLALHIGLNLLAQKDKDLEKICCGLMITRYFDYDTSMVRTLRQRFANDIIISDILCTEKQLTDFKDIQLLISTVSLPETFPTEWITTDPFLSEKNLNKIQKRINFKKLQKRQRILQDELLHIGNDTLFFRNDPRKQSSCLPELLPRMQELLVSNNYLPASCSTINTAATEPTIFGHVAVPNFICSREIRTGMVIVINTKPLLWKDTQIDICILLALNPNDWELVQYTFDHLINLLSEIEHLRKISKAKTYDEFVSNVINLIE
jgi:lichenan operon transcriptional antiterminator